MTSVVDRLSFSLRKTFADMSSLELTVLCSHYTPAWRLLQNTLNLDGDRLIPLFPFRMPYMRNQNRPVHHAAVLQQQYQEEEKERVRWRSAPAVTVAYPPPLPSPSPSQHDSTTR